MGTVANRESAVRIFVSFCLHIGIEYHTVEEAHVCWYYRVPGWIHRHSWVDTQQPGPCQNLFSVWMIYLATPSMRHVLKRRSEGLGSPYAAPLHLRKGRRQKRWAERSPIWGYCPILLRSRQRLGFIRQGNLVPRAVGAFDATRHLTRDDISRHAKGLLVRLKWTKTMQSSCTPTSVCLPQIPGSLLCPTAAYEALLQVGPTSSPGQPFIRYLDGNPITAAYLTAQWRTLIGAAGLDPAGFSLHSLRRGGAQFALHRGGALLTDVMAHGTWRSDAVRAYIRPDTYQETSVHRAFQNIAL